VGLIKVSGRVLKKMSRVVESTAAHGSDVHVEKSQFGYVVGLQEAGVGPVRPKLLETSTLVSSPGKRGPKSGPVRELLAAALRVWMRATLLMKAGMVSVNLLSAKFRTRREFSGVCCPSSKRSGPFK
jgi:hypothetical protein